MNTQNPPSNDSMVFNLPLPMSPVFVERVWGGDQLARVFGKPLPPEQRIGESWEAADIGNNVSTVMSGRFAGRSLRDLAEEMGGEKLFGRALLPDGRMPLLFKLIDAREDLSVQLHPSDADAASFAAEVGGEARGKEEAWYILDADKGARLVLGLKDGATMTDFLDAVKAGRGEALLNWCEVSPGEIYYIPPGLVHAIGKGILLAEIQQSSDTTYRLYDWGRVGLDGKPRQLHTEEAKHVSPPVEPVLGPYPPEETVSTTEDQTVGQARTLLTAEHFTLMQYDLAPNTQAAIESDDRFSLIFTVQGVANLKTAGGQAHLTRGETWLLPASMGSWALETAEAGWKGLRMCPPS